jgi:predicted sulfurtransferase
MTHESGRERHMTYYCEHCRAPTHPDLLSLNESMNENWCKNCHENEAEAAYERQQAADLESPPESAREEQIRTWEEHQKLHRR